MQLSIGEAITIILILISAGSTIGYLRTRIDNVARQVEKQNGRIINLEQWNVHHLEKEHSSKK